MSEYIMNLQRKTNKPNHFYSFRQQGVVLFIALIALVVMSLAAVALIRSVDTSTVIAGNLAAKQSSITSADSGLETAITWLHAVNLSTLTADIPAQGYYATIATDPTTLAWSAADSKPADDLSGYIDANGTDDAGNTVRYVVQRMCRSTGALTAGNCLFGAPVLNPSSNSSLLAPQCCPPLSLDESPLYRVTARVVGAKNTISFIQAFIY